MSQLALARRYRPRTFQAMVGQEVVLRSLCNALDSKRLHHAYLFTGTRGVGKTSIARILAKCLNCEQGVSSIPCGICQNCQEIDKGSFVDLIEVDAASRTKVEDTRDLLDNVQYLPARARFKIYLIDEVHMLSNHSFNALLKTLEEPPLHVKFLFATTDPQKLPLTILSRCLQFHLLRLPFEKIVNYLEKILQQEGVPFEKEAIEELSRGADGSLRDGLSLLDQALNFGNSQIETTAVRAMLGVCENDLLVELLIAIANGNSRMVLHNIQKISEKTPDFSSLLNQFLALIYQVTIAQSVPEALEEDVKSKDIILQLAAQISPEEVQLYYQIGLQGQRDLPYAPNPKIGFEMILLRMIAFQPARVSRFVPQTSQDRNFQPVASIPEKHALENTTGNLLSETKIPQNTAKTETILKSSLPSANTLDMTVSKENHPSQGIPDWHTVVNDMNLSGIVKVLAENAIVAQWESDFIHLTLDIEQKPLLNKRYEERLQESLSQYLRRKVRLKITEGKIIGESPAMKNQRVLAETQQAAYQMIEVDSKIQKLIQAFDAKIEEVLLKEN